MFSENGDSVVSCQVGQGSEVSELFLLGEGFEDTRLRGRVFEYEKPSAA